MNIVKTALDDELTLALEGRLDTNTSPTLENLLKDSLDNVTRLIFDFKKLEYISSAGLRVILSAKKTMDTQGSMVIRNVSDYIYEIFDMTGFAEIITIER